MKQKMKRQELVRPICICRDSSAIAMDDSIASRDLEWVGSIVNHFTTYINNFTTYINNYIY